MESLKTVGFIGGSGHMGSAIIKGILNTGPAGLGKIWSSGRNYERLGRLKSIGVRVTKDNLELMKACDIVIVCVKPKDVETLIRDLCSSDLCKDKLFISIAAGITLGRIEQCLSFGARALRVMPNLPVSINQGFCTMARSCSATDDDVTSTKNLFGLVGDIELLSEPELEIATSLCGSSPAFVYMAIESLADGACKHGLPRDLAVRAAYKMMTGAAIMGSQSGKHPGQLKDEICSPGGSTIAGVHSLEKSGFRASLIDAIEACTERVMELGK